MNDPNNPFAAWQQFWQQAPNQALPFLPPLQRRRLGTAARLLFDAAWPLLDAQQPCPVVFASHDGEINRSFELWLSLLRDNEVSPTSFGLSVHNALLGQWSMLRGDMSEGTALCVAEDGFETAFAEAYALLCDGAESVLVLVADEPLLAQYDVASVVRAPLAYAAAFVVRAGSDWRLSCQPVPTAAEHHDVLPYWGALNWLQAHYQIERWCRRPPASRPHPDDWPPRPGQSVRWTRHGHGPHVAPSGRCRTTPGRCTSAG